MKQKAAGLARRYGTALRKNLRQGPRGSLQPALRLGRQAVALGLETLELARIHEGALAKLALAPGHTGLLKRAGIFFIEAITPIVETHRAARQSKVELKRLSLSLRQRTAELAATHRELRHGTVRRKQVEAALKKSDAHYARLLKDSLELQAGLRQLTHQVLTAQEGERKKISRELQDEIAQTLLGINVRLLTLKSAAKGDTTHFGKEITSTQKLVADSVLSINRFARELDRRRPE